MRNKFEFKSRKIISLAEKLPYLTFDDLSPIENDRNYLKVLFYRYIKNNQVLRLKRGLYTTKKYIDDLQKANIFSYYLEFLANILYQPSYLSLDYILYSHNLLTELPTNFTSITKKKTNTFSNKLGNFIYHKIKDELFCGFKIVKEAEFAISRATKAKALFDFLYLRKNLLINKRAVKELRLNLNNFNKVDLEEFKRYLKIENSKRMKKIFNCLFR